MVDASDARLPARSMDFSCFRCGEPIPIATVKERLQDPPGKCSECGGTVIMENRNGALAEITAELGLPVGEIDVG